MSYLEVSLWFCAREQKHIKKRNPELTPLPVSQTLTSCQMLPVTVTGSAFDRKIVSVLPVPFCQMKRARETEPKRNHKKERQPASYSFFPDGWLSFFLVRARAQPPIDTSNNISPSTKGSGQVNHPYLK